MIGTLIGFALGPWGKIAGVVLALAGGFAWHKTQVWQATRAGYAKAITDIERANAMLLRKADDATTTVSECHARGDAFAWSREAGKCEKL